MSVQRVDYKAPPRGGYTGLDTFDKIEGEPKLRVVYGDAYDTGDLKPGSPSPRTSEGTDPPPYLSLEDRPTWRTHEPEDRSLWVRYEGKISIRFNPVVSIGACIIIWGFVLWAILDGGVKHNLDTAKSWVTTTWTWLYVGTQDCWTIFIVILFFSKYSKLKLGRDDEVPEYNDMTWFAMLFACGLSTGLYFYGVAEPIFHYTGENRYSADPSMPDNELAQWAMNITFYHWGVHGWIVYTCVGLLMGFMAYRKNLPLTMKSCFYPLLGDRIFGWVGDAIDIVSIVCTMFGVCTSLGLGTIQLNAGLNMLNEDIPIGLTSQIIIIWSITAIATVSVLSGVGVGIRRLSEVCFGLGCVLMMFVMFAEDTWFVLNSYTQSIGFYLQTITQLSTHTDAFEMAENPGAGFADRGRDIPASGPSAWMGWWTIFYWGWWIAWSPFVGMFLANISRGRTIREFITGTLTIPSMYTFLWFTIFGGSGLTMERNAAAAGLCCNNLNATYDATNTSFGVANFAGATPDYNPFCDDGKCNPCALGLVDKYVAKIPTGSRDVIDFLNTTGKERSDQLTDLTLTRLSCLETEDMWFALMYSYAELGTPLAIISIISIILYFVTSSDSGSLIIDIMAANGDQEPPKLQRVFWAITEGATATALLAAGGKNSLLALQSVSICAALPFTIILCYVCLALWRACAMEEGDINPYGPDFKVGVLDPLLVPTFKLVLGFFMNIIIAPYTISKAAASLSGSNILWYLIPSTLLFVAWPVFLLCSFAVQGLIYVGWICYIGFVAICVGVRMAARAKHGIGGTAPEDLLSCLICYAGVAVQVDDLLFNGGPAPLFISNKGHKQLNNVQKNEGAV